MMTLPFGKKYQVGSQFTMDNFNTVSGTALMRFYMLNECPNFPNEQAGSPLGYMVADMNRDGPYGMYTEVLSMAVGDPTYIGYMSSNTMNRMFPEYTRNFNLNFLSLPATNSILVATAESEADVYVKKIPAGVHGTYYAIINAGYTDLQKI